MMSTHPKVLFSLCLTFGLAGAQVPMNDGEVVENVTGTLTDIDSAQPTSSEMTPIVITRVEYAQLLSKLGLRPMKAVDGHLYLVSRNNTRYVILPSTFKDREDEWRGKLENDTESDQICIKGRCMSREAAKEHIAYLASINAGRVAPALLSRFAIMVSTLVVVVVVGITANVIIISGVLRSSHLHNSTSVFICSLSLADIIVLAVCPPLQVITRFYAKHALLGVDVCRSLHYIKQFSIVISSFTMAAMSIERFIAICRPLLAKSYCTMKNARNCTIAIWIFSLALCVPVVFLVKDDNDSTTCIIKLLANHVFAYYFALLAFVFGIPILVMLPMYLAIFRALWLSRQRSEQLQSQRRESNGPSTTKYATKMRIQVIKMLAVVLVVFVLSWGPAVLCDIALATHRSMHNPSYVWHIDLSEAFNILGVCNSFFNPIIYILLSKQFRDYAKSLCPCVYGGKKIQKEAPSGVGLSSLTVDTETD